jgi:hypothetical protein
MTTERTNDNRKHDFIIAILTLTAMGASAAAAWLLYQLWTWALMLPASTLVISLSLALAGWPVSAWTAWMVRGWQVANWHKGVDDVTQKIAPLVDMRDNSRVSIHNRTTPPPAASQPPPDYSSLLPPITRAQQNTDIIDL